MENNNLVSGLSTVPYVCEPNHRLLDAGLHARGSANIGTDGENLTITFLSLNRSTLSIRLLQSIASVLPKYRGEVLIIDNGSEEEELKKVEDALSRIELNARIVRLGKNYGVSGGRNKTIEHVNTEWVMFLDNDIYFVRDPLQRIQDDISLLGCHFLSLPLLEPDGKTLFSKGGNIYISFDGKDLHVGAGSAERQESIERYDGSGYLSTFLFGGACVINKSSFIRYGEYDECLFIGFEDIDYSIRLFQNGVKVGVTGAVALVHDHPKPATVHDEDYEKTRFTRDILYNSAKHLERKHGLKFWSTGVENWLELKHQQLDPNVLLSTNEKHKEKALDQGEVDPGLSHHRKLKIALVIDSENWAFGNIARMLIKHLGERYDFTVIATETVPELWKILLMTSDFDIVHFFWREYLTGIHSDYFVENVEALGFDYRDFLEKYVYSKNITTSVYDHLFLSEKEIAHRVPLFCIAVKGYTVSSMRLMDIYRKIDVYPLPAALAEDGVDLSLFKPHGLERFETLGGRNLVVGWAGNSRWASEGGEDFKGLHTLLRPAVTQLVEEGFSIELKLADRQDGFIAHDKMPDYYGQIDVYVCPSKIEGTPNPVLEAMACGVPTITTDVGVVPQVLGKDPFEQILRERSVEALKSRLKSFLMGGAAEAKAISEYQTSRIGSWDWSNKTENFAKFFDDIALKLSGPT